MPSTEMTVPVPAPVPVPAVRVKAASKQPTLYQGLIYLPDVPALEVVRVRGYRSHLSGVVLDVSGCG